MTLSVKIEKKYENFHLNIAFETQNNVLGILGASGCGKSMTLRSIAGIETPDSGRIVLNGRVLFDSDKNINLPPQQRRVGYLFQSYALFPNMTVEDNISFASDARQKKESIVVEAIEDFHLKGLEKKYPAQLSGGQQQRVALARLLVNKPEILLFDEPFSALDTHLRWKMEQVIMDVIQNFQGSVLIVSHNRDEIYRMCDKIAVYSSGTIDVLDEKMAVFQNPKTVSGAVLTGCKNISRAKMIDDNHLEAVDWGVALHSSCPIDKKTAFVGIRAHHLEFASSDEDVNVIPCTVVQEIDNPFSFVLMLKNADKIHNDDNGLIRYELDKKKWAEKKQDELYLKFNESYLLFLEKL